MICSSDWSYSSRRYNFQPPSEVVDQEPLEWSAGIVDLKEAFPSIINASLIETFCSKRRSDQVQNPSEYGKTRRSQRFQTEAPTKGVRRWGDSCGRRRFIEKVKRSTQKWRLSTEAASLFFPPEKALHAQVHVRPVRQGQRGKQRPISVGQASLVI